MHQALPKKSIQMPTKILFGILNYINFPQNFKWVFTLYWKFQEIFRLSAKEPEKGTTQVPLPKMSYQTKEPKISLHIVR